MEIKVVDQKGNKVETLKLNEKVFNGKVNKPLLRQAILMYLANQRHGCAKVKDRAEVSGGGKKPWRQKGTGRARAGSIRSPLWRHGGVSFGPKPKDWHYQLPKKMKTQALLSSVNAKLNEKNIIIIDHVKLETFRTKPLADVLGVLKLYKSKTLFVPHKLDDNLLKAGSNISKFVIVRAQDINAHDIIASDKILIEKAALNELEKKLTKVA